MFRPMVSFAVAIVLVLGCGKKKDEGSGGGDPNAPAPGVTPSDPNASYTIKIREPQKGDKLLVVEKMKDTTTITVAGKGEPKTEEESWEYVETILEKSAGARKPTKATREYKTAKATDKTGTLRDLPYAGKTVVIEQKGKQYAFSVNGKALPAADTVKLVKEFKKAEKSNKSDLQYFLPKSAVKLNESWTVDRDTMAQWAGEVGVTPDLDASSVSGKLAKVYTKDGKQWGTMEFSMKLVVKDGGPDGPPLSGSMIGTLTVDGPIDGSSPELNAVSKMTGDLKGTIPQGAITIKGGEDHTETVTVVK